jgi:energy-coupling factor transport system ATP-binding protein
MEDMAMYCDRVIVLSSGKVILTGTPSEVFSQKETLTSAGLDVPEITNIIYALRNKGIDIPKDIYTVKGAYEAIKGYVRRDK